MRIGILGAGLMADALGTRWRRAGHELMVSGRDSRKAEALAGRLGARAGGFREAAAFGDMTLLAVRDAGVLETLRAAGSALAGRPLIDCTNPIVPGSITLSTGDGPSMARRVADLTNAHVVKAFNLAHDGIWRTTPPALTVPLCGDDPGALALTETLVRDLGCTPVNAGGLERAGLLEATAAFVIGLLFAGHDPRAALPPFELAVRAEG